MDIPWFSHSKYVISVDFGWLFAWCRRADSCRVWGTESVWWRSAVCFYNSAHDRWTYLSCVHKV